MKGQSTALALAILLLGLAANAPAATLTQQFQNEFDTNRIWLWAMEPTTSLTNITFDTAPLSGWLVTVDTGDRLFFESGDGSTVTAPTGRFTLDFTYTTPTFSLEWAEILWDGVTNSLLGAGTAIWDGSSWSGSAAFTHAADLTAPAPSAIPIPGSIVFLASGAVLGIGFVRRPRSPI